MNGKSIFNACLIICFVTALSTLFFFENSEICETASKVKNVQTVIVDAGHGGEDGGAVALSGILEKQINLSISEKLEAILNLCGVNTDMTRRSDISLSTESEKTIRKRKIADTKRRVEKVVNTPGAVLISVHQNSFPQDNCSGAQVFFSRNNSYSKGLAERIQATLKNGIDNGNRRVAKENDKTIYLLENVTCPAVLVECGFLSNTKEALLLKEDTYQTKLAACIAAGFLSYQEER